MSIKLTARYKMYIISLTDDACAIPPFYASAVLSRLCNILNVVVGHCSGRVEHGRREMNTVYTVLAWHD